ncbi:hypothetical protein ACFQYP_26975 [Nonomuraea antimicrobica]
MGQAVAGAGLVSEVTAKASCSPGSNPPSGRSHRSSRPEASSAASIPACATGSSPDLNATARHSGVPERPVLAAVRLWGRAAPARPRR